MTIKVCLTLTNVATYVVVASVETVMTWLDGRRLDQPLKT